MRHSSKSLCLSSSSRSTNPKSNVTVANCGNLFKLSSIASQSNRLQETWERIWMYAVHSMGFRELQY
ncbi:hypothetical protein SCP_0113450 [Sparassis crispa]|uniref:Uncharacterized protein n=1 Tax=Sparassis crispa TaxID=139825 RepID=A0A401G8E8_9APHY|nr:hypothetical protein SCP_0113450 [Sparassis crispa]GBE78456.1 hypothetical protein SCP_0113450 [Sparassis crispa]